MKWLVLLGALLAAAGCGKRAGQCDRNSDCPAGQLCVVEHYCLAAPPPPPPPPPPPATSAPSGEAPRQEARPLCVSQCREVARACKGSCKLKYPRGPGRHDCAASCAVREHECRARARC